ncbi:MAG: hypothetical protein ABI898_00445 [Sphingomonadales bacterium]
MNWMMLVGSLVAVLALAGIAKWLDLGGDARLDADMVREFVEEQGFVPTETVLDRAGMGALVRDAEGRVMLVRRHGAHFVVHPVADFAAARLDHRFLTLGKTTLDLGDAAGVWAARLRRLPA